MSQEKDIHEAMKKGWVGPLMALNRFGCMRLASRIRDLRKAGIEVKSRWVQKNGKRWMEYRVCSEKPQKASTPSRPLNPEALRIVRLSKGIVPDDELARTFRTSKKVIREA